MQHLKTPFNIYILLLVSEGKVDVHFKWPAWLCSAKMTSLTRFMDLPALACTSNLHEPHQNKNHSLNDHIESNNRTLQSGTK